jgi:hypothetical protein
MVSPDSRSRWLRRNSRSALKLGKPKSRYIKRKQKKKAKEKGKKKKKPKEQEEEKGKEKEMDDEEMEKPKRIRVAKRKQTNKDIKVDDDDVPTKRHSTQTTGARNPGANNTLVKRTGHRKKAEAPMSPLKSPLKKAQLTSTIVDIIIYYLIYNKYYLCIDIFYHRGATEKVGYQLESSRRLFAWPL